MPKPNKHDELRLLVNSRHPIITVETAEEERFELLLLELAARWEGLSPALAGMAEALRLFVVTWDPLEWLAPRPEAVATASAWPVEIVVYVPVWSLAEMATRRETTMAAVLGALPLMVGTGAGSELRHPLGISIVGGLLVSQMLTLFTTPVIYLWFDRLATRFAGPAGQAGPANELN